MTEKKIVKLHEILAVEQGLGETGNRIQKEITKAFATKQGLFAGLVKKHELFSEENQNMTKAPEIKEVESTVIEQLEFLSSKLSSYWDVVLQKDDANRRAEADITIGDITLAEKVPSVVLLGLEKKLEKLIGLYNAIPTLDATTSWEPDPGYSKKNVFRTKHVTETQHTITYKTWKEVSPATKEHRAQLSEVEEIDTIGKYSTTTFSGAISPHDKSEKLERLTTLIAAVKMARQRANGTPVKTDLHIGKKLLDYING